jgi:hypothetical protein
MYSDFLLLRHGFDNKSLRVFDLLQHKTYVHRRELRLPGAPAIHPVLPDQCQSVCQDIQGRGHPAANRPHLKFVAFEQFGVVLHHGFLEILAKSFGHVDHGLQAESDPSGFVVFPLLLFNERTGDVEMGPWSTFRNEFLEE